MTAETYLAWSEALATVVRIALDQDDPVSSGYEAILHVADGLGVQVVLVPDPDEGTDEVTAHNVEVIANLLLDLVRVGLAHDESGLVHRVAADVRDRLDDLLEDQQTGTWMPSWGNPGPM